MKHLGLLGLSPLLVLSAASFWPVAPVFAQEAAAPKGITLESLMRSGTRQFNKLDLNHDGTIDEAEWNAYVEDMVTKLRARMAKRLAETDTNHDGKITKEEFLASRAKWFAEVDVDGSGSINSEKIRNYNYIRSKQPE